jgi:hypothetical protein
MIVLVILLSHSSPLRGERMLPRKRKPKLRDWVEHISSVTAKRILFFMAHKKQDGTLESSIGADDAPIPM